MWQKGNRNSQEIDVNMADMELLELIFCEVVQQVKCLRKLYTPKIQVFKMLVSH